MAVVVFDRFTGATASLATHTGDTGHGWSIPGWSLATPNRNGGVVLPGTDGTAGYAESTYTPPSADYDIGARIANAFATYQSAGLFARLDSAAINGYLFYWRGDSQLWELAALVGGSPTTLGTSTAFAPTTARHVRLSCVGTAIRGYVDGQLLVSATDSSVSAAGRPGLATAADNNEGHSLDDFYATDGPVLVPRTLGTMGCGR